MPPRIDRTELDCCPTTRRSAKAATTIVAEDQTFEQVVTTWAIGATSVARDPILGRLPDARTHQSGDLPLNRAHRVIEDMGGLVQGITDHCVDARGKSVLAPHRDCLVRVAPAGEDLEVV